MISIHFQGKPFKIPHAAEQLKPKHHNYSAQVPRAFICENMLGELYLDKAIFEKN